MKISADPEPVARRILALVGRAEAALPIASDGSVRLGVNHTVAGNPNRMERGSVVIRPDTEWQDRFTGRNRAVVTAITAALLPSFGYTVRLTGNSS